LKRQGGEKPPSSLGGCTRRKSNSFLVCETTPYGGGRSLALSYHMDLQWWSAQAWEEPQLKKELTEGTLLEHGMRGGWGWPSD